MRAALPPLVVMGVSGVGKSRISSEIAKVFNIKYIDADALHPSRNIVKMSRGIPLEDADRLPWLDKVGRYLERERRWGIVMACSALKLSYRNQLRALCPGLNFIFLSADRADIAPRLARRRHFMPPSLLDSQFAALEPLEDWEPGRRFEASNRLGSLIKAIVRWLKEDMAQ